MGACAVVPRGLQMLRVENWSLVKNLDNRQFTDF
jgi:hypothetical protein